MGLPTTWALLHLFHAFVLSEAKTRVLPERPGDVVLLRSQLCGDDAIVLGDLRILDAYDAVLTECGARKSPGKHFRSVEGEKEEMRGLFLERPVRVRRKRGIYVFSREFCVSVSGLVNPDEGLHAGMAVAVRSNERTVPVGLVVESLCRSFMRFPERERDTLVDKIFRVQMSLWSREFKSGRSFSLVPRTFGGLGFVTGSWPNTSIKRVASRFVRKALAVQITGAPECASLFQEGVACVAASEDAAGLLARIVHVVGRVPPTRKAPLGAPWYDCGPVDEFIVDQSVLAQESLSLAMPLEWLGIPERGVAERRTRVRKLRRELVGRWPGVRPLTRYRIADLVCNPYPHVYIPGTEDPRFPGTFGVPWVAGSTHQSRMRSIARSALGAAQLEDCAVPRLRP